MSASGQKRKAPGDVEDMPMDWDKLGFDFVHTDFMFVKEWKRCSPPCTGALRPWGDISISPAACALNYGQGIFEGLKAQRTEAGEVILFRPESNANRMQNGAERLCLEPIPVQEFVEAVKSVVQANDRWVPPYGKGFLYIRPCLWGSGEVLSLVPPSEQMFLIYCCPVGPYFKGNLSPISLQVAAKNHRACPGGQGGVKAIGNYAPGMQPAAEAKKLGYNEVIYLDAAEHKYIEEVGTANFFCVKTGIIYTPTLGTTILPGITRASVMQIAKDLGHDVREERVDVDFALGADEAFGTGTAAIVVPIGKINHNGREVQLNRGEVGEITRKLHDTLTGIQKGKLPDKHNWIVKVK